MTRVPRSVERRKSQCQMNAQVHNNVVSGCSRNTEVEHISLGGKKQVPPQPHTNIAGHVTLRNVNRSAPCEDLLHMANVKRA